MREISDDCAALDEASREMRNLVDRLALAELDYEDAMDRALIEVEKEYAARDERLPSERQRDAHARQKIDPGLRRNYLETKRRVDLLEKWGRIKEKTSVRPAVRTFILEGRGRSAGDAAAVLVYAAEGRVTIEMALPKVQDRL